MPFKRNQKLKIKSIEESPALLMEMRHRAEMVGENAPILVERECELRDLMGLDISIYHGQQAWKGNDLV